MNTKARRWATVSPLAESSLRVEITDLLAHYELRHTFRNEGDQPIEAIYSFPVPLDAAFVGMEATLAGETRVAQVLPARQATRKYDDALGEGDSAVLLEQVQPGMLCVNLGNLQPAESGEVVLRFAATLGVADGIARFSLPLVHRPRYGRSTLDALVEPNHDFAVEHPLDAQIRVRGLLADRPVQCGTQGARFACRDGEAIVTLEKAMLDRDLVLAFDLGGEPISHGRWIVDGEDSLGVLTFTVPAAVDATAPRDVCLLLDCSGSMAGDAIVQSRSALAAVAGALQPLDRIQAIRFGSSTQALFRRPLAATPRVRQALEGLGPIIEADLGGTDMDAALREALEGLKGLEGDRNRKIIILVTDGAVQPAEIQEVLEEAQDAGVRVFVVAVGSSAGVDVLAPLAQSTGATLERAVPAEPIDAGVMRQFRRARSAPVAVEIDWGRGGVDALPVGIAYPGDAVTAVARFHGQRPREIEVRLPGAADRIGFMLDELDQAPAWRAWVGQQSYLNTPAVGRQREALALRYGLVCPETNALLVKVRAPEDKIEGLPVVMPVAHMTPAGMLEIGTFHSAMSFARGAGQPRIVGNPGIARLETYACSDDLDPCVGYMDIPAFSRAPRENIDVGYLTIGKGTPASLTPSAVKCLVELLLDLVLLEQGPVNLVGLLGRVPLEHRSEIQVWLEYRGLGIIGRRQIAALLSGLEGDSGFPELDDDREALLCLMLAETGTKAGRITPL